jgi:hypothetical protein
VPATSNPERTDVEHDIGKRGVRMVSTKVYGHEMCTMVNAYVHHELPLDQLEELAKLIELAMVSAVEAWVER